MRQLDSYDALAIFYERYWGRAFLDASIQLFQAELARRLRPGDRVLELCCGAGYFAHWLAGKGYDVTGIDGSGALLAHTRRRLQSARFIQCDARSFCLPQRFNAAVCLFNSLNQFLEPTCFRAVLSSVYSHLKPGGWLLFDIVLEHGYAHFWEADESVVHGDETCELRCRFDNRSGLASCVVTISPNDASLAHQRQFLLCERPYSVPFVTEELSRAGLDLTGVQPVRTGMPPEGRVAVVARRPPQARGISEFSRERIIDDE